MHCHLRHKVDRYVDDELPSADRQEFSIHLHACRECPAAIGRQIHLKRSIRVAGSCYSAPPELHAALYRSFRSQPRTRAFWKWALAPAGVVLMVVYGFFALSHRQRDPVTAVLVDLHTTMLASEHPVDVISDNQHNVKPWFRGRLPFTFNMPDVAGSSFRLIGGKAVFVGQKPAAELLYMVGQHKVSVFVLQAADGLRQSRFNQDLSFTVASWSQGGLQCYLVTDANRGEADELVSMFREANRS